MASLTKKKETVKIEKSLKTETEGLTTAPKDHYIG